MTRHTTYIIAFAIAAAFSTPTLAGVVFGNTGLNGGFRWDAAPRNLGGLERSLDGGLRYSLDGGSFDAFRDSFTWSGGTPSSGDFQAAVQQAFDAWGATDPVTGLTSDLTFVADLGTAVDASVVGGVRQGGEIDLFATDLGDPGTRGFASFSAVAGTVELTSGTVGYAAAPISGADVTINSNGGAVYTLDLFRRLLTHELGHAIGFGDVEGDINPNSFIDDNYDDTSSATALATLTNSWAGLVDPLDPSASIGLSLFNVPDADPGVDTVGVDILMESRGLGIAPGNPITNLIPLSNDDYGIRQFLYPSLSVVPEPGSVGLIGLLTMGLAFRRRKQQARSGK